MSDESLSILRAGAEHVDALASVVERRRGSLFFARWMLPDHKIAETIALWLAHPRKEIHLAYDAGHLLGFLALERASHSLDRSRRLCKVRYLFTAPNAGAQAALFLLRSVIDAERCADRDLLVSFFGGSAPQKPFGLTRHLGLELAGTQCLKLVEATRQRFCQSSLVRRVAPSDLDELAALCRSFFHESNRSTNLDESLIDFRGNVASIIEDPRQIVFIARHKGSAVGFICGAVKRIRGTWLSVLKNSYWYVSPDVRGTYAAPALLGAFEACGRSLDAHAVAIGTSAGIHTERTRALLQRLGYRHVGDTYYCPQRGC